MKKIIKKLFSNFAFILLISAVAGAVVGLVFGESASVLEPLGTIFTRLLFMAVPAIVFFSIASSFANIGDVRTLGRLATKVVGWFIITTTIATIIGTIVGLIFQPGVGLTIPDADVEVGSLTIDTFLEWIPDNAFGALASGDTIQIVFLAIFIGIAVIFTKNNKYKNIMSTALNAGQDLFITIVQGVMYYAPIGIFALMASSMGDFSGALIGEMGTFLLAITLGFIAHIILVYIIGFWIVTKLNPFQFIRKILPALITAFSTASSAGTMPLTLQGVKSAGVDDEVADFGVPLGVTFNMDSMAVQIPIYIMLGFYITGQSPQISHLLLGGLMGVVFSIGTAGVPGGGLAMAAILVDAFGLPVEVIGLISGVFFYLDVTGTVINIWGDAVCSTIVASTEGQLNEDQYYTNETVSE